MSVNGAEEDTTRSRGKRGKQATLDVQALLDASGVTPNLEKISHKQAMRDLERQLAATQEQLELLLERVAESESRSAKTPARTLVEAKAAPAAVTYKPNLARKTFAGDKRAALPEWIFSVEQDLRALQLYSEHEDEDDEALGLQRERQVNFAGALLDGGALTWWRGVDQDDRRPASWTEMKKLMTAHFASPLDQALMRDSLLKCMQQGPVFEHTNNFRAILLNIPGMDKCTATHLYICSLKQPLAEAVRLMFPNAVVEGDLDRVCQIAQSAEDSKRGSATSTFVPRAPSMSMRAAPANTAPSVAVVPAPGASVMAVDAATGRRKIPKLTPEIRDECRRLGQCFRCRQVGHLADKCTIFPPNVSHQ